MKFLASALCVGLATTLILTQVGSENAIAR